MLNKHGDGQSLPAVLSVLLVDKIVKIVNLNFGFSDITRTLVPLEISRSSFEK